MTLILQQVAIVGIVGAAQTLVILTAGIDLSVGAIMVLSSVVMGQFTFRYGLPAPIVDPLRLCRRRALRLDQRRARRPHEAAAVHRDARHLADHPGRRISSIRPMRRSARRTSRPRRRCCSCSAELPRRQRGVHLRRGRHGASGPRALVHAQPHRLGPPCLCGRRRSGGGATVGRQRQAHAGLGLRHLGPDLRACRLGPDRPHRLGLADRPASSPISNPSPRW